MENNEVMPVIENAGAPVEVPAEVPESKRPSKKMIVGIVAGVVAAIIVVVAVVLAVVRPWDADNCNGATNCSGSSSSSGESSSGSGGSSSAVVENTALSAGTVTTTIGGKSVTYSGAYVVDGINATIGSGVYESSTDDRVVFLVINGGTLTIAGDVTVNKTGSANFSGRGDDYSFYGTNSAIVVVGDGSSVTIDGATITTSVSGANAVVATNGGAATVTNSMISTTKDNSRGLHATYAGVINADTVDISTLGGSCAALATDRGEGTVTATNMTLSTAGAGSPLIYSTGDITVSSSTGMATGAQIAVVEGKNSVTITDSELSANGIGNRNNVDNAGVMIYQSMSGDAGVGTGAFAATNSTFKILTDSAVYTTTPFFFVTNTTAEITLTNVTAEFYADGYFVLAAGTDEWGKSGSNGGKVTFAVSGLDATNQNVGLDEMSSVTGL